LKGAEVETVTQLELANARALLGKSILFRSLSEDVRSILVAQARIRKFAAGEVIFLMGSLHDSMMAVLSGNVKISVSSPDGKEILVAMVGSGEVFGELAMLDGRERSADARAITACDLAILSRRDVLSALDRNPSGWRGLVEVLCARLRRTDQHLTEVALLQLPVRLAKALLRIAIDEHRVSADNVGTHVKLSQRELGNMVGATRERVNKCIQDWQRSGIVRVDRSVITIVDRAALKEIAQQD
jgi:CRP/FNR family transcriptional regulator, cyclic AMP receptor protein